MTSSSTWQRHERHLANAFGGQRTRLGAPGADVVTGDWAVEAKAWGKLPAKVLGALQQAERSAQAGQVALAVIHQVGQRRDSDLVVMRWRTLCELMGAKDERT